MSYKLSCSYFMVPHAIMDSDIFGELSPTACKLLIFLFSLMNASSAPCIRISLAQLSNRLHMDNKTIRAARKELESKSVIRCGRSAKAGAAYELHVMNTETLEPFPPMDGRATVADYKARTTPARAVRVPTAEPTPIQHAKRPKKARLDQRALERESEETSCPIHGNANVYFNTADGKTHCGVCDPSPYAPPDWNDGTCSQRSNISPARVFTPPTAKEIFG
jgi:hypothetical protein